MEFSWRIRPSFPVPTVEVAGELDLESGPCLREQLRAIRQVHGAYLAIDLTGVTFIDCCGVNALLAGARDARRLGGGMRVAGASPCVRRLIELTGLQQALGVLPAGPLNGRASQGIRPAIAAVSPIGQVNSVPVIEPVIRRAEEGDLAAIARLRREWTLEQGGKDTDPGFEERFAAWFERESSRRITWSAEADGRLVGMMNLAVFERMPRPGRMPSRWGYLGNAFVLAAYRDQGIGGRLLHAVLAYADGNGFARVVVSPSERSIPFYRRAGFGSADALLLWTPGAATRRPACDPPSV